MNPFSFRRPPIWESSKRPLYPKCIWVEHSESSNERRRHYIFDHELTTRSDNNAASPIKSNKFRRAVSFEDRANNLPNLILVGSLSGSTHDVQWNSQTESEPVSINSLKEEYKCKETSSPRIELAERVLQWLDLAGRKNRKGKDKKESLIDRTIPKDIERKFPDESSIRKMSSANINASNSRRESVHCLSLKFDEESSNINTKTSMNFGEFFPVTYRSARKFLSLRSSARTASLTRNLSEGEVSGSTIKTARELRPNRKKNLFMKNDQIENQYRSLIQRQILQSSCNQQLAKRQLHIFMPNLPKRASPSVQSNRIGSAGSMSNNTVDTDSCINSELSINSNSISK